MARVRVNQGEPSRRNAGSVSGGRVAPIGKLAVRVGRWVMLLGLALAMASSPVVAEPSPLLFVFVHSGTKPRALQRRLSARLPTARVVVFGRFRDFREQLSVLPPDAVLAQADVLRLVDLDPELQGMRAGSVTEPYAVVAIGRSVEPSQTDDLVLGAVDMLGRDNMPRFIAAVMGASSPSRLKLVTKTEDLLPLLHFKLADAVVVPKRLVARLQVSSTLPLVSTVAPVAVRLPAVAFRTPRGRGFAPAIRELESAALGVDTWR